MIEWFVIDILSLTFKFNNFIVFIIIKVENNLIKFIL